MGRLCTVLLWVTALAIGWTGCYEASEGCLDPLAKNYNLSADRHCCCEYPNRGVSIDFTYDSLTFRLNRPFVNRAGDTFEVLNLRYMLSDFQWFQEGQVFRVEEKLRRVGGSGALADLPDDFRATGPGTGAGGVSVFAGSLREFGEMDSFCLSIGAVPDDMPMDAQAFERGHALDTASSALFDKTTRRWNGLFLRVRHGAGFSDTVSYYIDFRPGIRIGLDSGFVLPQGLDHQLKMTVKAGEWFGDVDWSDPEATVKSQIVGGIANSHLIRVN
jgi:hypothetical protein